MVTFDYLLGSEGPLRELHDQAMSVSSDYPTYSCRNAALALYSGAAN